MFGRTSRHWERWNWKLFHVLPMLVSVPEQEDPAPEWQVKLLVGQFEKQQPKTSVQRDHSSDICRYHSISATRLNLNQNRGFSLALNEVILQPQQNEWKRLCVKECYHSLSRPSLAWKRFLICSWTPSNPGCTRWIFPFEDPPSVQPSETVLSYLPPIRESPSVFFTLAAQERKRRCVFLHAHRHTHTLSHPVSLCWCWGSPACCVSVPSGQTSYADVLRSTVMKIGSCFDQSTCCDIPALPSPPEPIWNLRQLPITPPIQMNPFFPVRLDERGSLY